MKDKRNVKEKGYKNFLLLLSVHVFYFCRELSHSRSMSFPEKKSYNPHINIEYVDDNGRELTQKEVDDKVFLNSSITTL